MKTTNKIQTLEIQIENLREAEKNAPNFDIFDDSEENQASGQITLDIIEKRQKLQLELDKLISDSVPELSLERIQELSQPIL